MRKWSSIQCPEYRKKRGILLLLLLLLLSTTDACNFAQPPIHLQTSASPDIRNLSIGEPVLITWTLTNLTTEPVRVNLGGFSREHFIIRITEPNGNIVEALRLRPSGFHSIGIFTIEPTAMLTQHLVLNLWATFRKTGVYGIQIGIAESPVRIRDNAPLEGNFTAAVKIEFSTRNEKRLKERYKDLYERLMDADSVEEAATFRTALTLAGDELTIPFLAQTLTNNRMILENDIFPALARIGTQQAADVLIPYVNDPKGLISVYTRAALIQIRDKTPDAALKQHLSEMRIEQLKPVYERFGKP